MPSILRSCRPPPASFAGGLLVLLSACAGDASVRAEALIPAEAALESTIELDVRGDRALLGAPASTPRAQTDERPLLQLSIRTAQELVDVPGLMLGGALTADGAVFVSPDFELIDETGRLIDQEVIPELSVRADGRAIAYAHRAGSAAGVYVADLDDGSVRLATAALAVADRPLFLEDGRLLVVGARASGIAGVWIVDPEGEGQAEPVTNAELRTGRPLGPTFVPPPAYHASMRVEDGVLLYDDGRSEQRVVLPGGAS